MKHRSKLLSILALIFIIALAGCGGSDAPPAAVAFTPLQDQHLRAVTSEGWKQPGYVVRSDKEWAQAWATRGNEVASYCSHSAYFFCPKTADFQMPTDIDFSKHTLVGVYTQVEAHQVLSLASVTQNNNVIKVQTRLSAGLNTHPYFFYLPGQVQASWIFFLIPATTLAIEFEQKSEKFVPFKQVSARWLHVSSSQFDERGILRGGNESNGEGLIIGAGTAAPATFVFDTDADWITAWKALPPGYYQPGPLEIPSIDFNKDRVVGLSFGWGSNGCHGLRIINVIEDVNSILVYYIRSVPLGWMICTQAIVDVSDYIAIPQSRLPVKFVRHVIGLPGG